MIIIKTDNGPVVVDVPEDEVEPRPATPPRPRFSITWTGTDGTDWELCGGPVGLLSGARGFGLPTPQHRRDESPAVHGATWREVHYPPRELFLPVMLRSRSDMLNLERAFFAGLDPEGEGTVRVTAPDAVTRTIRCRYTEGAEGEYEVDPLLLGRAVYGPRMVADDPWWHGEPVTQRFDYQAPGVGFLPIPGIHVSATYALNRAKITNPGKGHSPASWRINAPFTGFSVGVGASLVSATLTRTLGQWVDIDLHHERLTIRDNTGADVRSSVTAWDPTPIPPGEVDLVTQINGGAAGSSVELTFPTLYLRAW